MYSASQREVGEHSDRVRLEVGAESTTLGVGAACLRRVYQVSASDRDLLMKIWVSAVDACPL